MIQQIKPDLFWIHPPSGGEVYVVTTDQGLVLVDSGFFEHKELILADMQEAGLDPRKLHLAFVTHAHCDHVGGLGWWQAQYGFLVVAHAEAAGPIERADRVITAAEIPFTSHNAAFIPCPIAYHIKGGETYRCGQREFQLIHAPGHTAGSIHILSGDDLFVGDTLFESGGIGWFDVHWGSNPEDYVETLQRLRPHIGKLALPGHGAPYVLQAAHIDAAQSYAAFYIPPEHGMGMPRPSRGYPPEG